jgi:hypothetical protein
MLVDIRTHVSINEAVAHLSHGGASAVCVLLGSVLRDQSDDHAVERLEYARQRIDPGGSVAASTRVCVERPVAKSIAWRSTGTMSRRTPRSTALVLPGSEKITHSL